MSNAAPADLEKLFRGADAQGKEFLENIRQYNCAFTFTSLGVQLDESINTRSGRPAPYVFRA